MRARTRALAALALAVALGGLSALASGEVWRYPEPDVPGDGPTEVTIGSLKDAKKGEPVPTLDIRVHDASGGPVGHLAVGIHVVSGKTTFPPMKGSTAPDGLLRLRAGNGVEATHITLSFAWDRGAKVIRAKLEPKGKQWQIVEAPYRRIDDGKDDGSCKNLFALHGDPATKSYTLEFRQPMTLLGCEEVAYGSNKKVHEIGNVGAIGAGRNVNLGDKNSFTPSDEVRMGLEASTQFDQQFEQIKDPRIVGYVQSVLDKIVAASDAPKIATHLRVVNTNDVNAFVTAGGHVYVFTGLIKAAQNESQLAGVLAHESSHAIARHVTEGATRNAKAQTGAQVGAAALGALLGLKQETTALAAQGASASANIVTLHFDRKAETEADLLGEQYLWKAGWDPEAIARFFELMEKQSGGKSSGPAWMSTHPTHEKRVENGILWARAYLPPKEKYLVDTAEFQEVKKLVAALPAPKKQPNPQGQKSLQQLMSETPVWRQALAQ
ncbi:MAG TPA: M48 family metalloprotease [Candidatus Polarisedimenticolaceae bacterium]|nr:M48 family metalloprotease [Candidatus Polarisedimenticolaceae bacterium]